MRGRLTAGDSIFMTLNYAFMLTLACITLYPFGHLLALSLNDSLDTLKGGVYLWPREWTLENYRVVLANDQLYSAAVMSVLRTLTGTLLGILSTSMFAYALSRREFVFRKSFNLILIITLYVNGGLIPMYLLIKNIGLINNFMVYILPLMVNGFYIIIMRSYFEQLPDGLVESAKIDGASDFQTLFRIILPVSLPVLATIVLFVAVMHWNNWFDNYLYTSRSEKLALLQYELMKILLDSQGQQSSAQAHVDENIVKMITPQSIRATMTIIVTMPILFVYPFLQKYFVKGMMIGAMKE